MKRTPLQRGHSELVRRAGLARGNDPARTPFNRKPVCTDPEAPKPARKRSNSPAVPKALREAVLKRDRYSCVRCGRDITTGPYSLQHRDPRGAGGSRHANTMANLVALCGSATTLCHGHVESYRIEARGEGYLVPDGYVPEEWPVLVLRRYWRQPGATWTPAQPHPEQVGGVAA